MPLLDRITQPADLRDRFRTTRDAILRRLVELARGARDALRFVWCEQVDDALAAALVDEPVTAQAAE